jgi:hypothetical protein
MMSTMLGLAGGAGGLAAWAEITSANAAAVQATSLQVPQADVAQLQSKRVARQTAFSRPLDFEP